jgi:murein DD-endopeptidase MepM/ murein hydrolase activator NlpD
VDVGKVNGHNLTVVYNHATSYRVGVGDEVDRGEVVGYAGDTGWSTGCHLHFTVLQDGTAVDPMTYL